MVETTEVENITLSKEAKEVILCFDKTYERRVMAHLYKTEGTCSFKDLVESCIDNPTHNPPISKACNRLKRLGIITSDGGKGRNGSKYEIIKERYELFKKLVDQINQLSKWEQ